MANCLDDWSSNKKVSCRWSYASMVAVFCTASHQYLYCVAFNVDGSYTIAFANIRTSDDPSHVEQEVAVRQLLQAQVPLSFPVELYSTFLGYGAMVPVWIQCLLKLFTYDNWTLCKRELTLSGRNGLIRVGWLTAGWSRLLLRLYYGVSISHVSSVKLLYKTWIHVLKGVWNECWSTIGMVDRLIKKLAAGEVARLW